MHRPNFVPANRRTFENDRIDSTEHGKCRNMHPDVPNFQSVVANTCDSTKYDTDTKQQ